MKQGRRGGQGQRRKPGAVQNLKFAKCKPAVATTAAAAIGRRKQTKAKAKAEAPSEKQQSSTPGETVGSLSSLLNKCIWLKSAFWHARPSPPARAARWGDRCEGEKGPPKVCLPAAPQWTICAANRPRSNFSCWILGHVAANTKKAT